MKTPLISVIVPCYNGASCLEACIASVVGQGVDAEVIVVDDGSTDDSAHQARELIKKFGNRLVVVSQANQGPAVARNMGIRVAVGKYLGFLDVDDEYAPGSLAAATEAFGREPAAVAVQGELELVDLHRTVADWQLQSMESTVPGNVLVRTDIARQIGGFPVDPAFRGVAAGEDGCFRVQLVRFGTVIKLGRPLLRYHVGRSSHTHFFLDRSVWRNGRMEFTEQSPEEKDGTLPAAFERFTEEVTERVLARGSERLQTELGAGFEFCRQRQVIDGLAGSLDPLEGFALYSLVRRWPVQGRVVQTGNIDLRASCWMAAGSRDSGGGKVALITPPESSLDEIRSAGLGEFVEIRPEHLTTDWAEPLRILFIAGQQSDNALRREIATWGGRLEKHGLVVLFSDPGDPNAIANRDQLRADTAHWSVVFTIQRLTILKKRVAS